jgi:hypothetical protein
MNTGLQVLRAVDVQEHAGQAGPLDAQVRQAHLVVWCQDQDGIRFIDR